MWKNLEEIQREKKQNGFIKKISNLMIFPALSLPFVLQQRVSFEPKVCQKTVCQRKSVSRGCSSTWTVSPHSFGQRDADRSFSAMNGASRDFSAARVCVRCFFSATLDSHPFFSATGTCPLFFAETHDDHRGAFLQL